MERVKDALAAAGKAWAPTAVLAVALVVGVYRATLLEVRPAPDEELGTIAQVRDVLHRRDDAAAAHAGELALQPGDDGGLRARDAREQLGQLLCGNLQHGFPRGAMA